MTIEVLSKPACVQCVATYRTLDSTGKEYNIIDMTKDAEALAFAKSLGHMSAPVVLIRGEDNSIVDHWSGFRPEKISEYAA